MTTKTTILLATLILTIAVVPMASTNNVAWAEGSVKKSWKDLESIAIEAKELNDDILGLEKEIAETDDDEQLVKELESKKAQLDNLMAVLNENGVYTEEGFKEHLEDASELTSQEAQNLQAAAASCGCTMVKFKAGEYWLWQGWLRVTNEAQYWTTAVNGGGGDSTVTIVDSGFTMTPYFLLQSINNSASVSFSMVYKNLDATDTVLDSDWKQYNSEAINPWWAAEYQLGGSIYDPVAGDKVIYTMSALSIV